MQVCAKVTSKLRFCIQKNRFLSKDLRRFLCKALIQPLFDYLCATGYANSNKKCKNKFRGLQNNCVYFCLQLDNREHTGNERFEKINWLPIDQRLKQCLPISVFKFFSEICPQCMNQIYKIYHFITRNSSLKLFQPPSSKAFSQ